MVVNATEFHKAFVDLGWDNLSPTEVAEWLDNSGISKKGVLAFCKSLLANPGGLDETTVAELTANERPYVVAWFKSKGVVI